MRGRRLLQFALLVTALSLGGCIPSNVVARSDRMVTTDLRDLEFEPAVDLRLEGFYASAAIEGDVALALRKVYYLFLADGTYTAAALVDEAGTPTFQTLSGTWKLAATGLALDGAEAVTTERCGELIRLTTPDGVLVLRKEAQ